MFRSAMQACLYVSWMMEFCTLEMSQLYVSYCAYTFNNKAILAAASSE